MRPGLFIWGVSRNWRDRDVTKTSTCINPALPLGCKPIECVLRIMVQLDVASEDAVGGERRQAAPQPFKFGCVDAGADAAGIDQLSVRP